MTSLERLQETIVSCTRCPRLVLHREAVAEKKRRMYMDWDYWGKPLPSFGDPDARLLIIGLAPAAHGGNRTGRMFTGDRSGDLLYRTLHLFGFASSAISRRRDDGLTLRDAYITAVLRCAPPANKPLREEVANCKPYLLEELSMLSRVRVVAALGKIAFDAYLATYRERGLDLVSPRPRFAHGATSTLSDGVQLIGSYHPSQQNTQTGRLTPDMFEDCVQVGETDPGRPSVIGAGTPPHSMSPHVWPSLSSTLRGASRVMAEGISSITIAFICSSSSLGTSKISSSCTWMIIMERRRCESNRS